MEMLRKEENIILQDVRFSSFKKVYKELYLAKDLLMRHNKIVVLESSRYRIMNAGHEGHQGNVKTKSLSRSKYWWPAMD